MSERKLATVRRIAAIDPIDGADQIICVTVDGWKLVSNKENGFKVGDLVIYMEIDSLLPCIPQFEWMRERCYKNIEGLGEGFLVRTIKLRGQVSQGLIVPLKEFVEHDEDNNWYCEVPHSPPALGSSIIDVEEGTDLTDFIGVRKYEKPIPAQLAGVVKGNFPSFIHKTDQERIQNCYGSVKNWIYHDKPLVEHVGDDSNRVLAPGTIVIKMDEGYLIKTLVPNPPEIIAERRMFEATLKLDGSSMTVYHNKGEVGVCSRNNDLVRDETNSFWMAVIHSRILDAIVESGQNIAIQGELMGPGVQGNREKLPHHMMFIFDVFDIDSQQKWTPFQRTSFFESMIAAGWLDPKYIAHVPVIAQNWEFTSDTTVQSLLELADAQKSLSNPIAEGIVFKSHVVDGPSFKAISNKFLLKEKD